MSRTTRGIAGLLVVLQVMTSVILVLNAQRVRELTAVVNRAMVGSLPERAGAVARKVEFSDGARVVVELYSDFDCAYCRQSVRAVLAARREFGGRVVWRFRYRANPARPLSMEGARLALCTADSTGPWQFYSQLASAEPMARSHLDSALARMGRSRRSVQPCIESDSTATRLWRDMFSSSAGGHTRTPTILVDGVEVVGLITEDALVGLIRDRLDRHRASPLSPGGVASQ